MDVLLLNTAAWHDQALARQFAWGAASVLTVLLVIFAALSIFGKPEQDAQTKGRFPVQVLLPFAAFGAWGLLIGFYQHLSLALSFTIGFACGIAGVLGGQIFMYLLQKMLVQDHFDLHQADQSTGKALKTIPPHRNGFGAVHLNVREAPFAVEAVTSGKAISPGTPVRVVGIIDERVVLVEPLDDQDEAASPLN